MAVRIFMKPCQTAVLKIMKGLFHSRCGMIIARCSNQILQTSNNLEEKKPVQLLLPSSSNTLQLIPGFISISPARHSVKKQIPTVVSVEPVLGSGFSSISSKNYQKKIKKKKPVATATGFFVLILFIHDLSLVIDRLLVNSLKDARDKISAKSCSSSQFNTLIHNLIPTTGLEDGNALCLLELANFLRNLHTCSHQSDNFNVQLIDLSA